MSNLTLIKEKTEEIRKYLMEDRLMPYQRASAAAICKHFNHGKRRALLADEVGLGKTEIAKGVIACMADEHWAKNPNRPFRVAYLCPNLDISAQNFPKLNLFPSSETQNPQIAEKLEEALREYRNLEDNRKGYKAVTPRLQEFLKEDSVYTRVCNWLIRYCRGAAPHEILTEEEKEAYLHGNLHGINNPDWIANNNSPNRKSQSIHRAQELFSTICDTFPENHSLHQYLKKCPRYKNDISDFMLEPTPSKVYVSEMYAFNREMARVLTRSSTADFRLSMQHLYTAEASAAAATSVMQLEALTPSTSLEIGNGSGTKDERALLAATVEYFYSGTADCEKVKKKLTASNYDKELFCHYMDRMKCLPQEERTAMKGGRIPPLEKLAKCDKVSDIRRCFIDSNLEHLEYDLVIMDEFQNFSKLIHPHNPNDEAYTMAQKLLNQKNTHVLMLSATPFRISDLALDATEDGAVTLDMAYDNFFSLARFMMMIPESNSEEWEEWKKDWCANRRMEGDDQREKCRELLMAKAGIFRTERIAAAKTNPVLTVHRTGRAPNFLYPMMTIVASHEVNAEYGSEDSRVPPLLGLSVTPYAYTFSTGYKLGELAGWSQHEDLFLTQKALEGSDRLNLDDWPQFQALQRDLMYNFPDVDVNELTDQQPTSAHMLWIPPSMPSKPLKGAFAGREGFSKTLIFTEHRMTSKAFLYLLCQAAQQKLQLPNQQEQIDYATLKDAIANEIGNAPIKYSLLKTEFVTYFTNLFHSNIGIAAVRSQYPSCDYIEAVKKYCEDGCFSDMLAEYITLLEKEYDGAGIRMANAVKKISNLPKSNCFLYFRQDDSVLTCPKLMMPPNKFAVSVFVQPPIKDDDPPELKVRDKIPSMSKLKNAFNSPFWPFVLTTTSIGTEGIDLHWYARNVVHWTTPNRPIDLEQREGRVLRFNCHAHRLNKALIEQGIITESDAKSAAIKPGWEESGLFDCQLNFFSDKEKIDGNKDGNEGCYHVRRAVYFSPHTTQKQRYDRCLAIVKHYRNMIGQNPSDLSNKPVDPLCLSPWLSK